MFWQIFSADVSLWDVDFAGITHGTQNTPQIMLSLRYIALTCFFKFAGINKKKKTRKISSFSPAPHCGDEYRTVWFRVHERQSDLSRGGVGLPAESPSLLLSSHSWYGLQRQEGLALKVVRPQRVVVQDGHHQTSPACLALLQGHQAASAFPRHRVTVASEEFNLNHRRYGWSLQLELLVKKGVEVLGFDLGAASLHLRKYVARFQTELHEGIAETWRAKRMKVRRSRSVVELGDGCSPVVYRLSPSVGGWPRSTPPREVFGRIFCRRSAGSPLRTCPRWTRSAAQQRKRWSRWYSDRKAATSSRIFSPSSFWACQWSMVACLYQLYNMDYPH